MREKTGEVFSVARDNAPIAGCTVSREVQGGRNAIVCFSLAAGTDISAEIHPQGKLLLMDAGAMEVYQPGGDTRSVSAGEGILVPPDALVGMRTAGGAVYTEISMGKDEIMNETVKAGEVFELAGLVPYQDGRIVNMDVAHNDGMKFVVMAFDAGTGLSEHAAPGEAIVTALDGEGVIVYEGEEHPIKAGESFHFAKGGRHAVKAPARFKMALLLTLE